MTALAYELRDELQRGHVDAFGAMLEENWRLKKSLARVSSSVIDDWYDAGRSSGALGGKLLGAGAGGFLMFYAPCDRHHDIEQAVKLRRVPFAFEPL